MLALCLFLCTPTATAAAATTFSLTAHLHSAASIDSLDALFWSVATPGSKRYLDFFSSPASMAPFFGGTDAAVSEAVAWLRGLNGTDVRVSPMRDHVTATVCHHGPLPGSALRGGPWSARGLPLRHLQPPGVMLVTRADAALPALTTATPFKAAVASPRASYGISDQKKAYKVPADRACTNASTLQMVWGPGSFGYSPQDLEAFRERECPGLNPDKVHFDTDHHGQPGGDNFGEGTLDVHMVRSCPVSLLLGLCFAR